MKKPERPNLFQKHQPKLAKVLTHARRWSVALSLSAVASLLLAATVEARVGGGQSYGGGGSHGGGGGDGGAIIGIVRLLIYLTIEYPAVGVPIDIVVVVFIVYRFSRSGTKGSESFSTTQTSIVPLGLGVQAFQRGNIAQAFEQLRKFDPNFSEIVFSDFCYALYAKAHYARAGGKTKLDQYSPYLGEDARNALTERNPDGLREVKGIIIGAMNIVGVGGLEKPIVNVSLLFETNYTELISSDNASPREMSYYVHERWDLERKRDVLSPPPGKATALHCPRCGAPLQKDTVGACAFCRTRIDSGEFNWYVRGINLISKEAKGPLLTADVPEQGTQLPTVVQPNFAAVRAQFETNNPTFSWGQFQARATLIFNELQSAWSTLDWERARPHESDNLFQMHQFWIEAYKRQHLRNLLDNCRIDSMQPVKLQEDAFYNSITLRIWASANDYTVDDAGKVVSGSKSRTRSWSEYWTFIRSRQAKPAAARADLNCPNCGAPLKVNNAGVCQFCGGKITSGEFDWILSRIEQDESYNG
jgi:predicted lipid-binding transport protein (Tim44 family)